MSQNLPLLQVQRLTKSFGGLKALDQIELQAHSGEILSIIGPNGSGKTTLFNLISGIYRPEEGEILFRLDDGSARNLVGMKPHQITAAGIARTFQNIRLFSNMSVIENVMVGMHCHTHTGPLQAVLQTRKAREEEKNITEEAQRLLSIFREQLLPVMNEPAKAIPYAYRKRLEVVRALASNPKLVLLDEPSAGMNPQERKAFIIELKRLRDLGYTLMVIEHDMMMVQGLSDKVIAFDYGRKIAEGTFEEVRTNDQVIEAYLGKKHAAT